MKNLIHSIFFSALFLLLLLVTNGAVLAQGPSVYGLNQNGTTNQFVQVDPYTDDITVINDLPNVKGVAVGSSTFNHIDQEYIFNGPDAAFQNRVFTIDALDGEVLSSPMADVSPVSNLIEMEYDLKFDQVFALKFEGGTEYLVQVDLESGETTTITEIPGVYGVPVGASTFDSNQGHYIFIGASSSGFDQRLYTIDVVTGEILSDPLLDENAGNMELQFDNTTGNLYGLYRDYAATTTVGSALQLISMDQTSGDFISLAAYPEVFGVVVGASTFSQDSSHYIFRGTDTGYTDRMWVIDVNDGGLVAAPQTSSLISELQCDNSFFAEKFYEKGEEEENENNSTIVIGLSGTDKLDLYPNPVVNILNVDFYNFSNPDEEAIIQIIDDSGRTPLVTPVAPRPGSTIDVESLRPGLYYIRVINGQSVTVSKFIKL